MPDLCGRKGRDAAMGHDHALGHAGGARGVNDISGMVDTERRAAIGVGRVRRFPPLRLVDDETWRIGGRQSGAGLGQDEHRPRILNHEGQARRRVRWIERQIGRARLEDGEEAYHHRRRPLGRQSDYTFRPNAGSNQPMRQTVGPAVECVIAQSLLAMNERHRIRCQGHLCLKQRRQGSGGGHWHIAQPCVDKMWALSRPRNPPL